MKIALTILKQNGYIQPKNYNIYIKFPIQKKEPDNKHQKIIIRYPIKT